MLLYFVLLFVVQAFAEHCITPNKEQGECVVLSSCTALYEALQNKHESYMDEFVTKSICGGTKFILKVCCGSSENFILPKIAIPKLTGRDLLPNRKQCGFQHSDDYYRAKNDNTVRINEFPWLARLKLADSDGTGVFIGCAGSLINTRYVLTSGFCVDVELYEPVGVRLGDYHKENETDCVLEPPYDEECSGFKDFGIEKVIRHPNYSNVDETNDIALLRLDKSVLYSDYIRPICLPSPETVRAKLGDILITSGWGDYTGKRHYKNRMLSRLITEEECKKKLDLNGSGHISKKIHTDNICTLLEVIEPQEGCNSDLGGPVMFSNHFQWHQEAIVSFSITCRNTHRPEVHTSLTNYIKWIEDSLEP